MHRALHTRELHGKKTAAFLKRKRSDGCATVRMTIAPLQVRLILLHEVFQGSSNWLPAWSRQMP